MCDKIPITLFNIYVHKLNIFYALWKIKNVLKKTFNINFWLLFGLANAINNH